MLSALKYLSLSLLFAMACSGCGEVQQKYQVPADAKPIPKRALVKGYLDNIATTGELDSGISTLPERIEELRASGVANVDELKKEAEELAQLRQPAKITALAKKMSAMIPADTAATESAPAPASN